MSRSSSGEIPPYGKIKESRFADCAKSFNSGFRLRFNSDTQSRSCSIPPEGSSCRFQRVPLKVSVDTENIDAPSTITDEEAVEHNSAITSVDKEVVVPKFPNENSTSHSLQLEEILLEIIIRVDWRGVARMRCVNKQCKQIIARLNFAVARQKVLGNRTEGIFSPHFFSTDKRGDMRWSAFNTKEREWVQLPTLNFAGNILPSLDPDLFKDHLMAHAGGLICINTGKSPGPERLVVSNPATQEAKVLPPMRHPRQPVLVHIRTDGEDHYKVVVAGSATAGTQELSLITEEYSSRTGLWIRSEDSDLCCPQFGLNEYQHAAYYTDGDNEYILCVAILSSGPRGILAYDLKFQKWIEYPYIPVIERDETTAAHLATTQILDCGGKVYVYSEQEVGKDVFICIHELILTSPVATWRELVQRKRPSGRGLLVHPEYICTPFSSHELCIFNTIEHTMEIIDFNNPSRFVLIATKPRFNGTPFHTLNPVGFTFEPNFRREVCPGSNTCSALCSQCEKR